jgi:hypothetical protein
VDTIVNTLNMDMRDRFRRAARARGVTEDVVEIWLRMARPQLQMTRDGDGPVVGRFGGKPELPERLEWPEGTACMATIDLAAVPEGSHDLQLPRDGRLVLFVEQEMTPETAQAVYVPAGVPVTEREPDQDWLLYQSFPLRGRTTWDIPTDADLSPVDVGEIGRNEDITKQLGDIISDLRQAERGEAEWQVVLGGYADRANSGVDNPVVDAGQETLLAQLALDDELVDDDFGGSELCLVSFVIRYEDLAAGRFDNAWIASDFLG